MNITSAYSDVLVSHDLSALSEQRDKYSGLFIPTAQPEYLGAEFRVMVVGQETKGWCGSLGKYFMARDSSSVDAYIHRVQDVYQNCRTRRPGKSRFLQFLRQSERELDLPSRSVHWANLFACDYKRQSPRSRPPEELAALVRISNALLALQIEHLKPDAILFTTGPQCDGYIKAFANMYSDGPMKSDVKVPRKLWAFEALGIPCFRTTHPRYVRDDIHRKNVLGELRILKGKRVRA